MTEGADVIAVGREYAHMSTAIVAPECNDVPFTSVFKRNIPITTSRQNKTWGLAHSLVPIGLCPIILSMDKVHRHEYD